VSTKTIYTEQATTVLRHAKTLAQSKNLKTIHPDELFWGVYSFLRNTEFFELSCGLLGLQNNKELDLYYKKNYNIDFGHKLIKESQEIPFNQKLKKAIKTNKNTSNITKLDFIALFYIAYCNLSSQCNNHLKECSITNKDTVKNMEKVLTNPLINKLGLLAFLEILHKLIKSMNLDTKQIEIMQIENFENIDSFDHLINAVENEVKDRDWSKDENISTTKNTKKDSKKMTVEYFGTDLTKEYKEGFIDPIIGRDKEIEQVIYTLLRKNKNNPLLIGEPGVGKTAIIEGLAQRIAQNQVPDKLKNKRIFILDMWTLVAGTKYRGEFEARMKSILEEAMDISNNIILFIDELHTIIGAGWQDNNDAAQMIKPLLARWKIKLIWATTYDEYQKHIEKDGALKRRFQEIHVTEPSAEVSEQILMWLKETYENFHGVTLSKKAVTTAVKLSQRYMLNKYLPDKALDIIDEACARKSTISEKLENDDSFQKNQKKIVKLDKQIESAIENQDYFKAAELKEKQEEIKKNMQKIRTSKNVPNHLRPTIDEWDIGNVLADKTGIPANMVNESEIERLKRLDSDLQQKIFWQNEAVDAIVKTITRSRLSVVEKNKPIWSFLFLGPTWVWKTYLAKLIAKDYFGDENALVRIDMSEFMEKFSISKLIGSPAGYIWYEEWWNLTETIRRKPYSVVLFDEIEKAAPDVLNIMLQILDEWRLKDSKGRWIDFKSTIIIMTSNIWSEEFAKKKASIGFEIESLDTAKQKKFNETKERVLAETKDFLSPELLNRIDHKIVFKPLSKKNMTNIFKQQLDVFLETRNKNTNLVLPKFNKKKIESIINKIYDPQYGARPITRYIHNEIEPQIIEQIMNK